MTDAEDVVFQTRFTNTVVLKELAQEAKDKYFNQDGTTNPSKITSIGKLDKEDPNLIVQGYKPLEVKDHSDARAARIGAFDGLAQGISLDLQTCSGANEFMLSEDKLLSSLEFNQISNFPGATDHSTISGSIKVHLIETSKGLLKIFFSITEGRYIFNADENFWSIITQIGSVSTMKMKYSFDAKFVAQDFSLSVDDNLIDAITYRHGLNGISIETSAATAKSSANQGCTCNSCCQSCASLCFICSTSQYQWNPKFCCCEKKEETVVEPPSTKFHRFLKFSASEEFVVGEVEKNEFRDKIKEKIEETVSFIDCPLYCGACCLIYQSPLKFGQSIIDKNPIIYCCPSNKLEKICPAVTWDMKEKRHDEINLVIHYISHLDQKNRSCTLTRRPISGEDVNATYNSYRKFIGLLADHRSKKNKFGLGSHFNSITLANFTSKEQEQ